MQKWKIARSDFLLRHLMSRGVLSPFVEEQFQPSPLFRSCLANQRIVEERRSRGVSMARRHGTLIYLSLCHLYFISLYWLQHPWGVLSVRYALTLGMCCGPGLSWNGTYPKSFVGHVPLIQPPVGLYKFVMLFQAVLERNRANLGAASYVLSPYGTVQYGTVQCTIPLEI
jgi:hypothetical protein